MTYTEWRDELKKNLLCVSDAERQRVLDYYAEAYADRREAGFSEREIINGFGAPYDAAQRILYEKADDGARSDQPKTQPPKVEQLKSEQTTRQFTPPPPSSHKRSAHGRRCGCRTRQYLDIRAFVHYLLHADIRNNYGYGGHYDMLLRCARSRNSRRSHRCGSFDRRDCRRKRGLRLFRSRHRHNNTRRRRNPLPAVLQTCKSYVESLRQII